MKNNFKKYFGFFVLLFVILAAFRHWFSLAPICYGDCLHFYPQNLTSFMDLPFVWDNRGGNSGLGSYSPMFLYMYPPSLIIGFLYRYFQITYNISEKLVWFFPFLFFCVFSIYYFIKVLKFSSLAFFFASIFYLLNTYILLVIGGGQVGIAMAYAIFPLSLALLIESLPGNFKRKIMAGLILAALGVFDIRIAFFALGTFFLHSFFYFFFEKEALVIKLKNFSGSFLISVILLAGLHFYWILPTVIGGSLFNAGSSASIFEQLEYPSWLNINHAFFVFQPHWYQNVFGRLQAISFEFFIVPILVFLPLTFRKINYKVFSIIGLALLFTFLTKGTGEPLPELYRFVFIKLFGFNILRDSTKFLIPQLTFYSLLIGISIATVGEFLRFNCKIAKGFFAICLIYLLVLVRQIFYPGLTGTFNANGIPKEYLQIKSELENDETFSRTLWYPGKDQFSYQDTSHPALNAAYDLGGIRPLNTFIEGTYDLFSYLKYPFSQQIFDILGIRKIYMVDMLDKLIINESDIKDKNRLEKNLDDAMWLKEMGKEKILKYENPSYSSRIFSQAKTFWVSGSDDLYRTFADFENFKLKNTGFVFLDEGGAREKMVQMLPEKDILFFNNKEASDLGFLLLDKRYFYNAFEYVNRETGTGGWGKSSGSQLVYWRNILETRGFRNIDFDLEKGFVWTDSPASMVFPIQIAEEGQYEIYLRFFANSKGSALKITLDNNSYEIKTRDLGNNFVWQKITGLRLSKGEHHIGIESQTGLNIVNIIAAIPEGEISRKLKEASNIEEKSEVVYLFDPGEGIKLSRTVKPGNYKLLFHTKDPKTLAKLRINNQFYSSLNKVWFEAGALQIAGSIQADLTNIDKIILYPAKYNSFDDLLISSTQKIDFEYVNPTKYRVKIKESAEPFMLVFSENFHSQWELKLGDRTYQSLPIDSTLNGFNIEKGNQLEGEISFRLQDYIKPGLFVSAFILIASVLILIL